MISNLIKYFLALGIVFNVSNVFSSTIQEDEEQPVTRASVISNGKSLEEFSQDIPALNNTPKLFDEKVCNFIDNMENPTQGKIQFVLSTMYSNDDCRNIPHFNQFKKSEDYLTLRMLKEHHLGLDYVANGKTNKEVCKDAAREVNKKHWGKTLISFYRWKSYQQ